MGYLQGVRFSFVQSFFFSFLHILHLLGYLFLAFPTLLSWNAFTERPVAPSTAAFFSPILLHLSKSSAFPTSHHESFCPVILKQGLCLSSSFSISGLICVRVKLCFSKSFWRSFAFTHPLILLFLEGLFCLLFLSFFRIRLLSLRSLLFLLDALTMSFSFLARCGFCPP